MAYRREFFTGLSVLAGDSGEHRCQRSVIRYPVSRIAQRFRRSRRLIAMIELLWLSVPINPRPASRILGTGFALLALFIFGGGAEAGRGPRVI
jgi:hypothetical protein